MPGEGSPPTGTDAIPRHFAPNAQLSAYGRLTRDPEAMTSQQGHPYTRARIACNVTPASRAGREQTWFVDVVAFRHQAAALVKCRKGHAVHVMGTLSMEEKTKNGRTYQNFTVTADALMGAATTRRTE